MRKKIIALCTVLALVVGMLPTFAMAKTTETTEKNSVSVDIYGFNRESKEVSIFTKGGKSGQLYKIYLNRSDNIIANGVLSPNTAGEQIFVLKKEDHPVLKELNRGDKLYVRIGDGNFLGLVGAAEAEYVNSVAIPTTMELVNDSVREGKRKEKVVIRFDKNYDVGNKRDEVRFVPFNKAGERLDRSKSHAFAIKSKEFVKRRNGLEMTTYFVPDADVAYYNVEFVSGGKVYTDLTKKLKVTPDYGDAKELVVNYKSDKVAIGETVKPELYILTDKNVKIDATENNTFTFVGEAVESSNKKDGSFTIKNDEKYLGSSIVVSVVNGPFALTKTFIVTDQEGNTEKKPPAKKKTNVIMGINSKDILINGVKRQSDAPAIIKNDRTFVPLRALLEAFGAKVEFDDKTRIISVVLDDHVVYMTIGQNKYTVDGVTKTMDVAPYIVPQSSRTMVPVRFAAEAIGFNVEASFNKNGTTANVVFSNM